MGCKSAKEVISRPLTWGGKKIRCSIEDKYFDLNSGRMIHPHPTDETRIIKTSVGDFKICGNNSQIKNFEIENGLTPPDCENVGHFSICGISTKAQVIKIVDADTFDLSFKISSKELLPIKGMKRFESDEPFVFTSVWRCRLNGVDAYEKKTQMGMDAHNFVKEFLAEVGNMVRIFTYNTDKYGRVLVDVFVGDKNLSEILIEKGFGYKYDGGKKLT